MAITIQFRKNTISVEEVAGLLGADKCFIRLQVEKGQIFGMVGGNETRHSYKIPRQRFYQETMQWNSNEDVLNGYTATRMLDKLKEAMAVAS